MGFLFPPYVMPVTQAGFRGQWPVGVKAPGEQHCTEQDAATGERKGARGDERGCPVNPVGAAAAEWATLVRWEQANSEALLWISPTSYRITLNSITMLLVIRNITVRLQRAVPVHTAIDRDSRLRSQA